MNNDHRPNGLPRWADDERGERLDYTVPLQGAVVAIAIVALLVFLHRPATAPPPGAASVGTTSAAQAAGSIDFESSLDGAMATAKTQRKPILIDFYTDWCQVCKEVDGEYSDPAVISALSNAIVVKINAEQRSDLAATYGVKGYPTLITMNSNGTVTNSMAGAYRNAGDFANWLRSNLVT